MTRGDNDDDDDDVETFELLVEELSRYDIVVDISMKPESFDLSMCEGE